VPSLSTPPVSIDGFTLDPSQSGDQITVKAVGNADMTVTTKLGPYLDKLHSEALRLGIKRMTFDIRELYFLTSGCLKCFATMLATVAQLDASQRYSVRFLANSNLHWQRRSLEALRCVAQNVIVIETSVA
jgi:hypothetical protein